MWLKANIKVLSAVTEGVSQRTGNSYKMQNLVLEWAEQDADGRPLVDATGTTITSRAAVTLMTQQVEELAKLGVQCYGWVWADLRMRTELYHKSDGSSGVTTRLWLAGLRRI